MKAYPFFDLCLNIQQNRLESWILILCFQRTKTLDHTHACTIHTRKLKGKSFSNKLVNLMLPGSSRDLPPSKMSFGGLGRMMFNHMMKNNMASLEEQIEIARDNGVRFQVCAPSLSVMGFDEDEWIVPVDICGVAAMYEVALNARTAYFIS